VTGDPGAEVPGVTRIDHEAVLRVRAAPPPRGRGLLGWLAGDVPEATPTSAAPETLAPPPADVQAEMRRMELEALTAELAALGALEELEREAGRETEVDAEPEPQAAATDRGGHPDADEAEAERG
jgi:hypothetical protein